MDNTAPKDPVSPESNPVSDTAGLTPQTPPEPSVSSASPGVPPTTEEVAASPAPLQTETMPNTGSATEAPKNSSKLLLFVLCGLVAVVIIVGAVYFIMLQNGSKTSGNNSQNQTAVSNPTPLPPTPTLTPVPDTSDTGLEKDNQAITEDLNNLDTQINQVNSALSDQLPNLQ